MALLSGIHPVVEALRAGNPLERIVIAQGAGGPRLQEIIDLARRSGVPVRFEPRSSLDRLASSSAHQGVIALGAARKSGMTEAEIEALKNGRDEGFSEAERTAIHYARELTRTAQPGDAREQMFLHFTHEQIVEITLVIAMANFTNRFNNGLAILPEA